MRSWRAEAADVWGREELKLMICDDVPTSLRRWQAIEDRGRELPVPGVAPDRTGVVLLWLHFVGMASCLFVASSHAAYVAYSGSVGTWQVKTVFIFLNGVLQLLSVNGAKQGPTIETYIFVFWRMWLGGGGGGRFLFLTERWAKYILQFGKQWQFVDSDKSRPPFWLHTPLPPPSAEERERERERRRRRRRNIIESDHQ